MKKSFTAVIGLALVLCSSAKAANSQIERGRYLVDIIGCSDCHTPGGLGPKPDMSRYLGGSDSDFIMPGFGVFVPPNLTPDPSGLGNWTVDQIVAAITKGVRPDGRILSDAMPWQDFARLSKSDAKAIAVYLKSVPAIRRKVPAPRGSSPCIPKAEMCIIRRE